MREHKYRARLKIKLGELPVGSWVYFCLQDTYFNDIIDWETCCDWTGLHDKNGTEIFEGDILRHSYYFDYGQWGELKPITTPVEVKWIGTSFSPFQGWSGYGQQLETCKVIGNIYENKELLEGI